MDPNEALRRLRHAVQEFRLASGLDFELNNFSGTRLYDAMTEAADAFDSLDEWLSRGGFPPADWSR